VFGPQSRWVIDLANQLTQGTAYLIGSGNGICNTVYIDNLIHALQLAMTVPEADGEAFFVGDQECVTWFDFYRPFAVALGLDPAQIPQVAAPDFSQSYPPQGWRSGWDSELVQKFLALMPADLKQRLKSKLLRPRSTPLAPENLTEVKQPVITQMMAELQQSPYKLPFTKAGKILGYAPIVSFEEGCQRSIRWLEETWRSPNRNPVNAS